jgi:predicted N-acetyltransferase YhbS
MTAALASALAPALALRAGTPADADALARICHAAFAAISRAHGFPPDFPEPAAAAALIGWMLGHPGFHAIVAEEDGRIVGSNFVDLRNPIAGIGPITVDPTAQNRSIGRHLMNEAHRQARAQRRAGVRLVQAAYHGRSLSLYAKLGYDVREPLACLAGKPLARALPGRRVRPVAEADFSACNALAQRLLGHARGGELADAIRAGTARLVERQGRITGYAGALGFAGHAVGEANEDLKALIAAADAISGPGFLLPTRNTELFRWCLMQGLSVVQPMTLMSLGPYADPAGAFLPSIWY